MWSDTAHSKISDHKLSREAPCMKIRTQKQSCLSEQTIMQEDSRMEMGIFRNRFEKKYFQT